MDTPETRKETYQSKHDIPKEFLDELLPAISEVWSQIGQDVLDAARMFGDRVDNEAAVEACIDANRLSHFGFDEAEKLKTALIKKHSYFFVLNYLSRRINLV